MKIVSPFQNNALRGFSPLIFIALLALFFQLTTARSLATTYYLSTTGTDTNAGDINNPLATIMRAQTLASPGDTVMIESGTYAVQPIISATEDGVYCVVNLITKNNITYMAVPGSRPVLDFSAVNPTGLRTAAFWVTGKNDIFQGFDVVHVQENITTVNNQSLGFGVWGCSNCQFNQVNVHDGECVGFYLEEVSANNLFYQCDSYNNNGINSFSYGNADGFGCHPAAGGTGNILRQCRSWNNSDDGYDCLNSSESVTFDHCWSYLNGNNGGNGNGFKVGGWASSAQNKIVNPVQIHSVVYCLSANNNGNGGYYANHQPGQAANWWHNTAFDNSVDFNMLERPTPVYSSTAPQTDADDVSGTNEVMHYNMAFTARSAITSNYNGSGAMVSNNSWTESLTLSSTEFQSTVVTQMTQPRQANGALPVLTFMVPAAGNNPTANLGCFTPPSALTWSGVVSGTWNVGSANWLMTSGSADVYSEGAGQNVTFNDAATTGTITIPSPVNPGTVTFSNSALPYLINSASAGISGAANVIKNGSSSVTLTGTASYTGGTVIAGGTYALGSDSATTTGTAENPGISGGTNRSLGANGVLIQTGGQLRFGGRGGSFSFHLCDPESD